jgi:putative phosphoesterase
MKRIAVISDIHGNLIALKKVVQDIERRGVNLVVNLGDHISGPLWPKATLDYLKSQDWVQIRGNHERQLLTQQQEKMGASDLYAHQTLDTSDLLWLSALPESAKIGTEILLCHGSPVSDKQYLLETIENGHARLTSPDEIKARIGGETAPIILCGHTHIPRIVALPSNQLVINPGSVGLPAYDDVEPEPHVMEAGSPHARYAILEQDNGEWVVDLITISYDHNKAAEQAMKNGREDWAVGLRSGYFTMS